LSVAGSRSARAVPYVVALIAAASLVLALAAALVEVRVPRLGDGSAFRCSPLGTVVAPDETVDCASHVHVRLAVAAVAGIGSGIFGLLSFVIAIGVSDARSRTARRTV